MNTIGERIKQARMQKGLSQSDLAEKLGLSAYQSVQQWETGRTAPRHRRLQHIAQVLDVSEAWLVEELAPPETNQRETVTGHLQNSPSNSVPVSTEALLERIRRNAENGRLSSESITVLDNLVKILVSGRSGN